MDRDAPWLLLVGVLVVVVIAAVGVGALGQTRTVSESAGAGRIPDPAGDGSAGVIMELRESGGFSLFGVTLGSRSYEAFVGFVAPAECVSQDETGHEALRSDGVCADLPARGEVSGNGTTADGLNLVIVTVDISKRCYEALAAGETWPVSTKVCGS